MHRRKVRLGNPGWGEAYADFPLVFYVRMNLCIVLQMVGCFEIIPCSEELPFVMKPVLRDAI